MTTNPFLFIFSSYVFFLTRQSRDHGILHLSDRLGCPDVLVPNLPRSHLIWHDVFSGESLARDGEAVVPFQPGSKGELEQGCKGTTGEEEG